jgi:hypothetical protein
MDQLSTWVVAGFFTLHFGAIVCAWGTRVALETRFEAASQCMFLLVMAAVGFAAWFCLSEDIGLGIPSGATLIVMVLTAVSDFRRTHEPAHRYPLAMHS